MQLILAVEPNRSQAQQLASLVKQHLKAELVSAASADAALKTLGDRIPDLVLAPALLPSRDEAALTERLRGLGTAASHVHTLAVPILSSVSVRRGNSGSNGLLGLRRDKENAAETVGCDPQVFADQIKIYLERAATERAAQAQSAIRAQAAAPPVSDAAAPPPPSVIDTDVGLSDILDTLWLPEPVTEVPSSPAQTEEPLAESLADPVQDEPAIAVIATDDVPVLDAHAVADVAVPTDEPDHVRPQHHAAVTTSPIVRAAPAAPSPHVRSMEAELGLLRSETSSPPLWRVTEGLDTFASSDDILMAEPVQDAISMESQTSALPSTHEIDPQASPMTTDAPGDDVSVEVIDQAAIADGPLIIDVSVPVGAVVPEVARPAPAAPKPKGKMPRAPKKPAPPLDDWAYFDPSQSPFKALVRRLDEIAGQAAAAG
jgi:CheY-like chemotaxis protein